MPQTGFVGVRCTKADWERADALCGAASQYSTKVLRELNQLESFMMANDFSHDMTRARIFALFGAQFLNSGRSPTTLDSVIGDFDKFHVDPFNIDLARDKVNAYHVQNAIMRSAKTAARCFIRNPLVDPKFPAARPEDYSEGERWAFWALIVVTGNRPNNVLKIDALTEVTDEYLDVKWGMRKVRANSHIRYPYEWTVTPPEWIQERWRALGTMPWPWKNAETIASSVSRWLKAWGLAAYTSTSPRGSLDEFLRGMVLQKRLDETLYERIIDHKLPTGLDHYSSGPVNASVGAGKKTYSRLA
jgi:hypothetical protein